MLGSGRVFQSPIGMDIGLQLLHPLSVHGFPLEQYWRQFAKLISTFGDDNTERQMVSAEGLFSGVLW